MKRNRLQHNRHKNIGDIIDRLGALYQRELTRFSQEEPTFEGLDFSFAEAMLSAPVLSKMDVYRAWKRQVEAAACIVCRDKCDSIEERTQHCVRDAIATKVRSIMGKTFLH
jgi:hypothetical protein